MVDPNEGSEDIVGGVRGSPVSVEEKPEEIGSQ